MIYLLYPSCRPDQIEDAIVRGRADDRVKVVVGCNGPRKQCEEISRHCDLMLWFGPTYFEPPYSEVCAKLMRAAVVRFLPSPEDLIGYWSDDFYPQHGYPDVLRCASADFLLPRDGVLNGERAATMPFVRKAWLDRHMGGFFWPPVYRYVVDVEPYRKAKALGDFKYLPDCFILHRNHFAGTRPIDHVDRHNLIRDNRDQLLIDSREQMGFPVTWSHIELDQCLPAAVFNTAARFIEVK